MSPPQSDSIQKALGALDSALDGLEEAVDRHVEDRDRLFSLDNEMSNIMLDRSRLAQELDQSKSKAMRLEDANREVSRRLVKAMETIRHVLENKSG